MKIGALKSAAKLLSRAASYVKEVFNAIADDAVLLLIAGVLITMLGLSVWNAAIIGFGLGVTFSSATVIYGQRRKK